MKLKTVHNKIILKRSQIRKFSFQTEVFERYSRVEKALDSVMLESYISGVSTRNVTKFVKALGIKNVSPSHISPLTSDLDVNILIYLRDPERSMESYMKFIYIDATYFNVNMGKNTEKKDLYPYALV